MTLGGGTALGVSYLIYIILEFNLPTCQYLGNINNEKRMYEIMGELFISPPMINFYVENYHIEKDLSRRSKPVKYVTHKDSYNIPYYSFKDVSGLFLFNQNDEKAKKKIYIKLYLKPEINFSDPISYSDYINQKELFWRRNRFLDSLMAFKETRYILRMKRYTLV